MNPAEELFFAGLAQVKMRRSAGLVSFGVVVGTHPDRTVVACRYFRCILVLDRRALRNTLILRCILGGLPLLLID